MKGVLSFSICKAAELTIAGTVIVKPCDGLQSFGRVLEDPGSQHFKDSLGMLIWHGPIRPTPFTAVSPVAMNIFTTLFFCKRPRIGRHPKLDLNHRPQSGKLAKQFP